MTAEYRTATALLDALRKRQVSALELTDAAIARIEAEDGRLNAVPVRDFDRARMAAREADAALGRGDAGRALLGLPMTVKESYNIAGLPTTWGIPGTQAIPVREDAVTVTRLKQAGAVILGKSNVSTALGDWQSANAVYGFTRNPWNPERTPGGSSGGAAAALAAGYVPLEMGSDLAGSLRVPSHFCGTYAHKPSLDLVPTRGHAPPGAPPISVSPRFDLAVVGPMARSAVDLMLALEVVAGPDDADAVAYRLVLPPPRHQALRDFRLLVLDTHPLVPADTATRGAIADFVARLEKTGCRVARSSALLPDLAEISRLFERLLMGFIGATVPEAEYARVRGLVAAPPPGLPAAAQQQQQAMLASHRDWMQAHLARTAMAHRWRQLFRDFDLVLCPVAPTPAFAHDHGPMEQRRLKLDGQEISYGALMAWAGPATLCGLPATAFPIGLSPEGLPIGLQAIGPYLEDRTPIHFAMLAEQAFGGFRAPPA